MEISVGGARLEYCVAYDALVSAAALKNLGLAHMNLVRSRGREQLRATRDVFQDRALLNHTHFRPFDDQHAAAFGPEWKTWASSRFQFAWGEFLRRPEAKRDPQYETIAGIYAQVTSPPAKPRAA